MKKLKNRIERLGFSYRKEVGVYLTLIIIVLFLGVCGFAFLKKEIYLLLGLMVMGVVTILYYQRYVLKEIEIKKHRINDFINYFSFLRIYILNGESVYTAITKTLDFADESLKPYVEDLISQINEDKSINPYMKFAKNFDNKLVDEIMISVYEMVDNGSNLSYINQFTTLFENFKLRINKENEDKRIESFGRYVSTSLLGSGMIMIILVFGIVNLVGEAI